MSDLILPTERIEIKIEDIEFSEIDGVFIKQMKLPFAGCFVPQHSHNYDHCTLLAHGSVKVYKDGDFHGEFKAPAMIEIKAMCKHTFESLEPSVLYCIHNVSRTGEPEIHEEHQLSLRA